jgi:hypothetical protein
MAIGRLFLTGHCPVTRHGPAAFSKIRLPAATIVYVVMDKGELPKD